MTNRDSYSVTDVRTDTITLSAWSEEVVYSELGAQVVNEDTALAVGGISVTDVDGNLSTVQLADRKSVVKVKRNETETSSASIKCSKILILYSMQKEINGTIGKLCYNGSIK